MLQTNIFYSLGNTPCKDCNNRNGTCHTTCSKYKEYKAALEEMKKKIASQKREEKDLMDYECNIADKGRRGSRSARNYYYGN